MVSLKSPDASKFLLKTRRFSAFFRQISLYTFGTFANEFACLREDSKPSDHMLDDSESFGGQEMIADVSEIS